MRYIDRPATEKQTAYVAALLARKQTEAREYDAYEDREDFEIELKAFWATTTLPADLSAWEASTLIDMFKRRSVESIIYDVVPAAIREAEKAEKNGRVYPNLQTSLALFAFEDSMRLAEDGSRNSSRN